MAVLVIEPAVKDLVAEVVQYAEANHIGVNDMKRIMAGELPPAGDDIHRACIIPRGYRCVFTIEQQPMGWCKHLSISVNRDDKYPHPLAVDAILSEFGMPKMAECLTYVEQEVRAINMIAKL